MHEPRGATAWWRRWPEWSAYAAAAWALIYGALGLYWSLGGAGFPFGFENDRAAHLSALAGVDRRTGAPAIAVLGLLSTGISVLMARGRGRGPWRMAVLGFAWIIAVVLTVVIPDFRVMVIVAYAPILILGTPFGWPGDVRLSEAIPWPVVNQAVCILGGLLWTAAVVSYQRRTRGACAHCGRSDLPARWTAPALAARWGQWAVRLAVAMPLVYAATRWAWALGFRLGISEEFYRAGAAVGLWWIGAALATLAVAGALLTFGLSRSWGEVVPRWIPLVGGKAVPRALVIVPAIAAAIIVTSAGLMFVRAAIAGSFRIGDHAITLTENWGALLPELLWPAWGLALGAAALAYYFRTRGRCPYCGRAQRPGDPDRLRARRTWTYIR